MKLVSKKLMLLNAFVPVILTMNGCGGAKFSSGGNGRTSTPPVATPAPTPAPTPAAEPKSPIVTTPAPNGPICTATQKSIGSNIAFLIDNSSSNIETDCPGAVKTGTSNGTDTAQCASETNREKSVLAAFDLLAEVSTTDTSNEASSNLAIVGFPAVNNSIQNVQMATNGWVSTRPSSQNRTVIQSALQFTRQPYGATPYQTAVDAASGLFRSVQNDGRSRVAVLVTDGEATDRDPKIVAQKAESLRQAGVEVITVFITNSQARSQRIAEHRNMLMGWDQRSAPGHYYNVQSYQNFDSYFNDIVGGNGRVSLADAVTSKVVPSCVDSNQATCQRWKVEIPDASGLANVVKQIIRTRAVKCQ